MIRVHFPKPWPGRPLWLEKRSVKSDTLAFLHFKHDCFPCVVNVTGPLIVAPVKRPSFHAIITSKPPRARRQIHAVQAGRLDAGFVFTIANIDRSLARLEVAVLSLLLAVPKGHPLTKLKKLRLKDLAEASFIWFPRRESPMYYDRLMHECFRGGLKSPRILQEAVNEATILSLVRLQPSW